MLNQINWLEGFEPGNTDNFVSNEIIIKGVTAQTAWKYIVDTKLWPLYYDNVSKIELENNSNYLVNELKFNFNTFEFLVQAQVKELQAPTETSPGRIGWYGLCAGDENNRLEVYHAFLFENVANDCVRILTQETQIGKPGQEMALQKPNPMLNAHQDWLEGIASVIKKELN
ncbi:MAG: SRPBCC domain-containing protein [Mycoplasmatales bacterium]